jgi:hypothetical protein
MRGRIALQKHYRAKFREGGCKMFSCHVGQRASQRAFSIHRI